MQRTYERLAKNTNNDALKAIALQRLADLALEDKQASLAGEQRSVKSAGVDKQKQVEGKMAEQAPAAEQSQKQEEQTNVGSEPAAGLTAEEAAEKTNVNSAIHQYERLLTLYPDYAGNDRVMYQLARAYELNGDLEKTLDVLTRLVKQYPNQPNYDELEFRRGEILFSFREFEEAEKAYGHVVAMSDKGPFYERAMFKHGWSVFKQGATQRSLKSYFAVLDRNFSGERKIRCVL